MIYSIVIFLLVGNLFFWWWGDRHLRPLRKAVIWRALLAALIGGQSLMLGWWVVFPGTLRSLGNSFWKPASAWLYMWHLLVLPTTLLALLFGYSVYWLGGLLTRLVGQRAKTAAAIDAVEPADESVLTSITGPAVIY